MFIKSIKTMPREIITDAICDECGKTEVCADTPDDWYIINSYHEDWGNDSVDSHQEHLVCSAICYIKKLKKIAEEFDGYETTCIDGKSIRFIKELTDFIKT